MYSAVHMCVVHGNSYQIMVYVYFNGGTTMPLLCTCTWYCIVVLTSHFFLPRYKHGDCFPTIHNGVWCAHHVDQDI